MDLWGPIGPKHPLESTVLRPELDGNRFDWNHPIGHCGRVYGHQGKALSTTAYLATYSLRGVAKYRNYAERLRTAEQLTS